MHAARPVPNPWRTPLVERAFGSRSGAVQACDERKFLAQDFCCGGDGVSLADPREREPEGSQHAGSEVRLAPTRAGPTNQDDRSVVHAEVITPVEFVNRRERCRPVLRLFAERVLLETERGDREVTWPVLSLSFDYGGRRVRALSGNTDAEWDPPTPTERGFRDEKAEAKAQQLLERFGAVEIDCVDGCIPPYGSEANYLVSLEPNAHAACSFSAQALPELEKHGFTIIIDPDYPYQVLDSSPNWYGKLEQNDEQLPLFGETRNDWFSLELGILVQGEPFNLVPALVELLEQTPDGASLNSLALYPARFRAIHVGDNRYLAIPWERLERILLVLRDLYDPDQDSEKRFDFVGMLVGAIGRLQEAVEQSGGSFTLSGSDEALSRAQALSKPPAWSAPPSSLNATLRPYQLEGLCWMEHLRSQNLCGILADDMGLGKTLQTIAHLTAEKEARRTTLPSLIVVPTSLVGNWQREFSKFAKHLRVVVLHGKGRHAHYAALDNAEVVITTYPVLIRDQKSFIGRQYHYAILDEAQTIKNPRSLASQVVRQLDARHRMCLSGTPVENNLGELWALFDFLMPGFLGSAEQFKNRFRTPIEEQGDEDQLTVLRERVAPFILRRVKESVASELPPKTELVRAVELSADQRDLYESIRAAAHGEVRSAIKKRGFAASSVAILDALMKLRQVCCDPRLVSVEAAGKVEQSAKLDLFMDLLTRQLAEGRRVLVFSQFAKMLALLGHSVEQRGIKHLTLTGASNDRQGLVDAFERGEADVFFISLKAGGTGLNLVSADTVIHYDPWWNAAAQMQATDRAYRIGQKRPVFVYNLIVSGSVEERMLYLQRRKRALADTLLSRDRSGIVGLQPDDIDDLFAPLE